MPNTFQHLHVDTEYIYAYIIPDGNDKEKFLKKQLQFALVNPNSEIQIKMSFIALGETLNSINSKPKNDRWKKNAILSLYDLIRHEKVDPVPPIPDMYDVAKSIKTEDPQLGYTDVLIVSQALCDTNSYLALFHDVDVLNSMVIQGKCRESSGDDVIGIL